MRHIAKKKGFLIIIMAISLLVGAEISAKIIVYYVLDIRDSNFSHHYRKDTKLKLLRWTQKLEPHPYFGFENKNIRQFEKLENVHNKNDFVIGILGGSVAEMFAGYVTKRPEYFDRLREAIPSFANKNLRIANLAMASAKQPQQFFIATYFMDQLDLVINIDGLNDAHAAHLLPVYPLEFPFLSLKFYQRTNQGGTYVTLGRIARWTYSKLTVLPGRVPLLSRSSLYFSLWYGTREILYKIVKWSEAAYYATAIGINQSEVLKSTVPTEIMEKRIKIWKRYTTLQNDVVGQLERKPVFFFVQPNQYLKNSKILSDEEKSTVIDNRKVEQFHEMMVRLKGGLKDLQNSGIPLFDLTRIFSDTRETVYIDDCCHLNDRGNHIMAEEIVAVILRCQAENPPPPPKDVQAGENSL